MKKVLVMLLCLALVLPLGARAQVFDYTIGQLLLRQLEGGGASLRVKVSAQAAGAAPSGVEAQTWETVKSALEGLNALGTYYRRKTGVNAGNEQITGKLFKNEQSLTSFVLTGIADKWYLESDLLPGKTYTLARNMKEAFMNLTTAEDGQWPSILRLLTSIETANEKSAAQLDLLMNNHMLSLNAWLQKYTVVTLAPDQAGKMQMQQEISVPAAEMVAQIKKFLTELYADDALLAHLRTIVPQQDAHAYLESGMMPLFSQALDALNLTGEVKISRAYDGKGNLAYEEISLPFGGEMPLRRLLIGHGDRYALEVEWADGSAIALSASGGFKNEMGAQTGAFEGEISILPAEGEAIEALYTLSLKKGMEQYLEENEARERDQLLEAALVVRPRDGESFASQSVSASMHLTAGSSSTRPAYVDNVIIWRDLITGSQLTLNVNLNTSAGLRQSDVMEEIVVAVDDKNPADRTQLLNDLSTQLSDALSTLFVKMLQRH